MKAIVTGVSGQDGHYMARLLLGRGCRVIGLTSNREAGIRAAAEHAGAVDIELFDYHVAGAFTELVDRHRPDMIFNLAAKATGRGMFDAPLEMGRINGAFVLDILEAIRTIDPAISYCQASSAEMYGDVSSCPQDERTCFRPKSPYGVAKLYAHNLVGVYRDAYGLRAASAILYNHESVRRSTDFVTRKIARAAASIKLGLSDCFSLGSLDQMRDWGYAPEYVEAMFRMATAEKCNDYVVATGRLTSVERVCELCFGRVGLDYRRYLRTDPTLIRPINTTRVCGDPSRISRDLGWSATTGIETILAEMVDADLNSLATESSAGDSTGACA